jgi:transglutaminase-like putative cysteine protease
LCQVASIPARLIFLFYSDNDGHVIAEFYADGRWCMADSSWGCVFPGADGKLMSAAQCHADAESKHRVQEAYLARARDVASATDALLVGRRYADMTDAAAKARKIVEHASDLRKNLRSGRAVGKLGEHLWAFGVMNTPLPP